MCGKTKKKDKDRSGQSFRRGALGPSNPLTNPKAKAHLLNSVFGQTLLIDWSKPKSSRVFHTSTRLTLHSKEYQQRHPFDKVLITIENSSQQKLQNSPKSKRRKKQRQNGKFSCDAKRGRGRGRLAAGSSVLSEASVRNNFVRGIETEHEPIEENGVDVAPRGHYYSQRPYIRAHVPYMHVTLSVPRSMPPVSTLLPPTPVRWRGLAGEN